MNQHISESLMLPSQLQRVTTAVECSAAARLMEAVLEQTAHDLRRYRDARDPIERRLFREACNWVRSPDESHPFAFVPLCETLGYSPAAVRLKLVGNSKPLPGRFVTAARRVRTGTRAALVLLSLLLVPLTGHAATMRLPDVVIALDAPSAALTLSVANAAGLEGADLTIAYDPVALAVSTEPRATDLTADCLMAANYATPGLVHVSLACPRPLADDGALLTLTVQPQRIGTSALEIPRCDLNEQLVACAVNPGSVTVEPTLRPATYTH